MASWQRQQSNVLKRNDNISLFCFQFSYCRQSKYIVCTLAITKVIHQIGLLIASAITPSNKVGAPISSPFYGASSLGVVGSVLDQIRLCVTVPKQFPHCLNAFQRTAVEETNGHNHYQRREIPNR